MNDWELIQLYAKNRSEAAFAELVQRHLAWVYSVAMRQVGHAGLAEEVAQSVFILLARKAGSLRSGTILGGWLFRTTCFVGSRARRAEQRQQQREQTVSSMTATTTLPENIEAAWERLSPELERAVAALSEPDRAAILLRFYEKKPLHEVGHHLGISEDAAKKRVSRAVGKLRTFMVQRGVTLGGAAFTALLTAKTVQAAPVTLAASVLKAAAAGASASATLPQLTRETLKAWRWANAKLAAGLATASLAVILLAVNSGGLLAHRAALQPVTVNNAQHAEATTTTKAPVADAFSAPTVKVRTGALTKTGVVTGLVLDEQGNPIAGAKCGAVLARILLPRIRRMIRGSSRWTSLQPQNM